MMNCPICTKAIELVPSAHERAKRFGGRPADYTRLFTEHAACTLVKRKEETDTLVNRNNGIECPQCPLARQKGTRCRSDYHDTPLGYVPMRYPMGKP